VGADGEIYVLEAGCGSATQFCLPEKIRLAGIDTSQEQLDRNQFVQDKILGDLEQYELPPNYDIILCYDVLEHLEHPQLALGHMIRAMRPGAILIICAPARESFKGVVTRLTPHWFHVFVYKYMLGDRFAGQPGRHPFPTYLKKEMGSNAIIQFTSKQGLSLEFVRSYGQNTIMDRLKNTSVLLYYLAIFSGVLTRFLTAGLIRSDISDFALVVRKPIEASTAD
jgi:SAM-dependent methyltransferase